MNRYHILDGGSDASRNSDSDSESSKEDRKPLDNDDRNLGSFNRNSVFSANLLTTRQKIAISESERSMPQSTVTVEMDRTLIPSDCLSSGTVCNRTQTSLEIAPEGSQSCNVPLDRQAGGSMNVRSISNMKADCGIIDLSDEDLAICCRVINKLAENTEFLKLPRFRSLRKALDPIVHEQMKNYRRHEVRSKPRKRSRRAEFEDERNTTNTREDLDRIFINRTQLRASRMAALERLNEEQSTSNIPRIPDGAVVIDVENTTNGSGDENFIRTLQIPISCYVCQRPFVKLHFFYSQLCPDCAAYNYQKRNEKVDLNGYVSLVTGGRTKIGFRCALKLLRCGSQVIVTTRFPFDCLNRYKSEVDFHLWSANLHVYALDFRDLPSVEAFCRYANSKYEFIDIIINNAAQTVRRPASYYSHLIPAERSANSLELLEFRNNIALNEEFWGYRSTSVQTTLALASISNDNMNHDRFKDGNGYSRPNIVGIPYELSQLVMNPDEDLCSSSFPTSILDVNGQQVDLRSKNSWTMRLHEISTTEIAEVFAINAIAPTIINSQLKTALERSPHKYKFIVNVSAMEGKFYRFKTDKHPHTNMAKAALNMQTRTSAQDYVKSGIYMTCVDTGWINDEKPIEQAKRHQDEHNFQTPIDEIDAAARILDPIISPLLAASTEGIDVEPPFGIFLKDYMKCEW